MRVTLSPAAARFLKRCSDDTYQWMREKHDALAYQPFPADAKRVAGRKERTFRIRGGDHRVLSVVFAAEIFVADKGSRIY